MNNTSTEDQASEQPIAEWAAMITMVVIVIVSIIISAEKCVGFPRVIQVKPYMIFQELTRSKGIPSYKGRLLPKIGYSEEHSIIE